MEPREKRDRERKSHYEVNTFSLLGGMRERSTFRTKKIFKKGIMKNKKNKKNFWKNGDKLKGDSDHASREAVVRKRTTNCTQ